MLGRNALSEKLFGLDGNIRSSTTLLAYEAAQIGQLGLARGAHHLIIVRNACLEHLPNAEPGRFAQELHLPFVLAVETRIYTHSRTIYTSE